MTFEIDSALLPATLTGQPMTDGKFAAFCAEHPDLFFETTAEGEIIVIPPTYSLTGFSNNHITRQLGAWAIADGRGIASESSTGFVLPNGARRSPDAG
jgi:Uma2 family endonuclease